MQRPAVNVRLTSCHRVVYKCGMAAHRRGDTPHSSGLYTAGSPDLHVWAGCTCGWLGPERVCLGRILPIEVRDHLVAERAGHEAEAGHGEDLEVGPEGRHTFGCGFYHPLNQFCPLPEGSPAAYLHRALVGVGADTKSRALDRLSGVDQLRRWLARQDTEAAIEARVTGATWAAMGAAIGTSRQGAWKRWGDALRPYQEAGLLPGPGEQPAAPVPPVVGEVGLRDARSWCRWCGHRVVASGLMTDDGPTFQHHEPTGWASKDRVIEVPDCPGPEPWPTSYEWLGV